MNLDARAHALIHSTSVAAAGVGAGLAQLPGSDAPILTALQASMVAALASLRGAPMLEMAAAELVGTLGATMAGRGMSQALVGWIPGWGNALNASTAAAVTEAVGWMAWRWLQQHDR